MKYVVTYWIIVVVSIPISYAISSLIHSFLDIPRGVPLARLGMLGSIGQISLMILPFLLAPIGAAVAYYKVCKQRAASDEVTRLSLGIAFSTVLLSVVFWIGTGAWFGLIQGEPWFILLVLAAPPAITTVCFWVLFSAVLAILSGRSNV